MLPTALQLCADHSIFLHLSCPRCCAHPHLYCETNGLLTIAVWHLWHQPLLCLGKQCGCRAYSSREHRRLRQEGMADCGLHHGSLHRHPHPAHLAHAASCQGMHPSSHPCPFVLQSFSSCSPCSCCVGSRYASKLTLCPFFPTAFIYCGSNIRLACCDEVQLCACT